MSGITSRPYSTAARCEACVFGSGDHADWCEKQAGIKQLLRSQIREMADRTGSEMIDRLYNSQRYPAVTLPLPPAGFGVFTVPVEGEPYDPWAVELNGSDPTAASDTAGPADGATAAGSTATGPG